MSILTSLTFVGPVLEYATTVWDSVQYNFIAKWQMHQEYVVVPSALTHTLTTVIKKKMLQ